MRLRSGDWRGSGEGRISEHIGVCDWSLAGVTVLEARLLVPERYVVTAAARPEAQHDLAAEGEGAKG